MRSQNPEKIILATGVSSTEAAKKIRPLVDEFISLMIPDDLYSISQFYENFPQVDDDEVVRILHGQRSEEGRGAW